MVSSSQRAVEVSVPSRPRHVDHLLYQRWEQNLVFDFGVQLILLSIMMPFFRTNMHHYPVANGGIYLGALFFTTVMIMFNGFSEVPLTIFKLPVFFKHRDLLFYLGWTRNVPSWILKTPITFIQVFSTNICFSEQLIDGIYALPVHFRAARNMIVAYVFGSFVLLVFMQLGGFILSRDSVTKWCTWGHWISPPMYVQNAASVNEFFGYSWQKVLSGSAEPCASSQSPVEYFWSLYG